MVFELIQENFTRLGINKTPSWHLRFKLFIIFSSSILNIISVSIYLITVPNNFKEYIESIYMTAIAIMSMLCYLSIILKQNELFAFFDRAEELLIETESE